MPSNKISKKQLRDKQILEEKKFRKNMIITLLIIFLIMISAYIFIGHWCETKYIFRKFTSYGKEIPANMVCMQGNRLTQHESIKLAENEFTFYVCEDKCKKAIQNHFEEVAFTIDAFSGDTICKADALIGLKERRSSNLVYFKNKQNFNNYYESNQKKSQFFNK